VRLDALQAPKPKAAIRVWRCDCEFVLRVSHHVISREHSTSPTKQEACSAVTGDAGIWLFRDRLDDGNHELVDRDIRHVGAGRCNRRRAAPHELASRPGQIAHRAGAGSSARSARRPSARASSRRARRRRRGPVHRDRTRQHTIHAPCPTTEPAEEHRHVGLVRRSGSRPQLRREEVVDERLRLFIRSERATVHRGVVRRAGSRLLPTYWGESKRNPRLCGRRRPRSAGPGIPVRVERRKAHIIRYSHYAITFG
jgi:hypothetical protein